MRILVLVLFLCRLLDAQAGSLDGVIVHSLTRQPIAGVHISLAGSPVDNVMPEDTYGAISRSDGHYSISNLKPGTYFVTLTRNGLVQMPSKDATGSAAFSVTLKAGEQLTGHTLEMAPRALIAGRVTDEYGQPVNGLQVQGTTAGPDAVRAVRGMYGTTDDHGEYRMTGSPGKYRIRVLNNRLGVMRSPVTEVRSDGTQPEVYGTTWYPSAESEEHAGVVEVAAGHDATGIDVRLLRQRGLSISGIVTGLANSSRAQLYLFPAAGTDLMQQFQGVRNSYTEADGKFSLSAVAPGSYRLSARSFPPGTPQRSQTTDIRIDSADVTGVQLQMSPGEELSGILELPPGGKPGEKAVVMLEPLSQAEAAFGVGKYVSGEVDKEGAFRIPSVFPGRLRVRVDPLPENAYVKTVRLDSVEAADGVIDLSRGVKNSTLKISVSPNGAQVDGSVVGEDGKPAQGAMFFLVFATKAEDIRVEDLKRVNPGVPFSFKGVRPGKYKLFAVDILGVQSLLADIAGMFPKAPEIVVRESDRITNETKVMTREKSGAK